MTRRHRLSAVLRLREVRERRARGALGAAERELAERARERERRAAELPPPPPQELLTPVQLRVLALQGVRAHELLEQAGEALQAAAEQREEVHRRWSETSRERKSAERLQERREAEAAVAARKAAERTLDDLAVMRRGWLR